MSARFIVEATVLSDELAELSRQQSQALPSQSNPEQLVHCRQATAWSLDVQSQQLLPQSEVIEDEIPA